MDNISSDEIDLDEIHQDQDAVRYETYPADVTMKIRFETLFLCKFFVVVSVSVADPYHVNTYPDPWQSLIRIRI